jgi:hypothetical protein
MLSPTGFVWEPLTKEYQSTPVTGPESEHWHLILSGKEYETKSKALTSLAKALFSGKADAVAAINALAKTFKYHRLSAQTTKEKMGHKRKGRQPKGAHNVILGYHLNATVLYQLH